MDRMGTDGEQANTAGAGAARLSCTRAQDGDAVLVCHFFEITP